MRELEKLALSAAPGEQRQRRRGRGDRRAGSAERRTWTLADALVAGDTQAATRVYLTLRAQGERVPGQLYWMAQRVRTALEIAQALDRGEPPAQIKRGLRMPSRAADRLIADARASGSAQLQRALEQIADLELASRGGGAAPRARTPLRCGDPEIGEVSGPATAAGR